MLRRSAVLAAALMLAPAPAPAQDAQPSRPDPARAAARLKIGDRAPALSVEKWLKGEPVTGFEKGRVYLVEFWATWCGGCIMSMPHLSELQHDYRDKGVTVIGVDVMEKYTGGTSAAVDTFVKEQGERMAYTVAYDGTAKGAHDAFYKASGRERIPAAFLIDRNGAIAYIGHPLEMDWPLKEVVAGTWDLKAGPETMRRGNEAHQQAAELLLTDARAGLAAWGKAEEEHPQVAGLWSQQKWQMLLQAKMYDEAYAAAGPVVDQAIAQKNGLMLNDLAWTIVDPQGEVEKKDLDLAMKAALKADEFTGHKDPYTLDTLALVYFLKGDANKALELQQKAFDLAPEQLKGELKDQLEQYKKAAGKG